MRTWELPPPVDRAGAPPFLVACGWCPMPDRTPPMLVGDALCRAELIITHDGRGPVAKLPVVGLAAGTRHGSQVTDSPGQAPPPPPRGRCPELLVGGALCLAELSITRDGRGLVEKPPVIGPAVGARHRSQTALSKPPLGRRPELLVGGALCRAEPSHGCGWCPMPGGNLPQPRRPAKASA